MLERNEHEKNEWLLDSWKDKPVVEHEADTGNCKFELTVPTIVYEIEEEFVCVAVAHDVVNEQLHSVVN